MFSFVANSANNQTPDETLLVATYELGKIIECNHYEKRYGAERIESKGFNDHGKTEVADLISMIRMYCEQKGWNYNELEVMGESRYVSRMRDLVNTGKKEQLKKEYQCYLII